MLAKLIIEPTKPSLSSLKSTIPLLNTPLAILRVATIYSTLCHDVNVDITPYSDCGMILVKIGPLIMLNPF